MYTRPDSATWYAKEGIAAARRSNDRKGEIRLLDEIAHISQAHGNFSLARKYEEDVLNMSQEINFAEGIGSAYSLLGVIEGKSGNRSGAARYFIEALKIAEQRHDTSAIVETNMRLGIVNEYNQNLDKALEYYTKADKLNKGQPLSTTTFTLMNSIGGLYIRKGETEKALAFFEQGITQSNTPRFTGIHLQLLGNAGTAQEHLGNKAKAMEYHKRMLEGARQIHMPEEEARALVNIANVLKYDSTAKSIAHLKNALLIAEQLNHKGLQSLIYKSLSDIYQQQANYREALLALERHHQLEDSLFNLSRTREIASLETSYELEESRNKIQKLELTNQQRTFERNIGGIIAVSILLILVTLTFYFLKTQKLNKQLRESNQVKDKLFSIIGHDLSGPVTGTTSLLSLMENADLSATEQKHMFTELRKQSELTADILHSLLSWGKTQLQGMTIHQVNFHPDVIIEKNILLIHKQAQEKEIHITQDIPKHIMIHADQDHFDFVIRNLLSNAVKFTYPSGIITIHAMKDRATGYIIFTVKDNGKGINEDSQSQLFNINPQRSFGTRGEKGTGLGLMLCKDFIEANQGHIWIESKEGEGTSVYFSLKNAAV